MGMFNFIIVNCPECNERLEFKTKSGSCVLRVCHISEVSGREVEGILGDSQVCGNCGTIVKIKNPEIGLTDYSYLIKCDK